MTTLSAARRYLRAGLAVIPAPRGKKRPVLAHWPDLRLTLADLPSHFSNGCNVGILNGDPSGGLVDIDLDAPEAIAVASHFLPETACIFGRDGKPRSHREYVATRTTPETVQYKDIDGTVLVELRSTGSQTIWPGSTHPSGEAITFDKTGDPARVDGHELRTAVACVAACTLLARHWPTRPGARHHLANAIAGFCLRRGLDEKTVARLVKQAARAAGDEQWRDRGGDVRATAKTLAAGKPATGGPTLTQLVGDRVVEKTRDWLGLPDEDQSFLKSFLSSPAWPDPPAPEAYYGLAGEIVRTIEPHSEADPVALLVQLLVAFGSVIGRTAHFVVERTRHYLNLFAVLVGPMAKARKGSAWGQTKQLLSSVDSAWASDRIQSGLSSGEGLIWAVRDAVGQDPGVPDKRLLVVEGEFAGALRVMGRDGNTLSTTIRDAWDSGDLRTLTKNSPARATGAHISLIGHITRDELQRYLTQTEAGNGFANRFLWVCVRRSKALPEGGRLADATLASLVEQLRQAVAFSATVQEVTFDEEARAIWHVVYPTLSEGKPGLLGAVIARAEAQVMRLACLCAVLDCSEVIRREHLLAALALWDYCEASARCIFGEALGDPLADELLQALRASPDGLTRTEIRDLFARNRNANEISRTLGVLLRQGLAHPATLKTGEPGRPEERWYATPGTTTKTMETTRLPGGDGISSSRSFSSYLALAKAGVEVGGKAAGSVGREAKS